MHLNAKQIGEYERRDFLTDEVWKRWKLEYDRCMAYRKTLKGKPTEEERANIDANAMMIEFYGSVLFHSVVLAQKNLCVCTRCGQRRAGI